MTAKLYIISVGFRYKDTIHTSIQMSFIDAAAWSANENLLIKISNGILLTYPIPILSHTFFFHDNKIIED